MKAILTTLTVCCASLMWSQVEIGKQETKIILYSGEIINGIELEYNYAPQADASFKLDNSTYASSEVRFFQNNHGYFANLGRIHGENAERYALRIRKGKMNLYEEIEMDVYSGDEMKTSGEAVAQDPLLATGESFQYYNIGDEQVREAKYGNLVVDLKDNAESMKHLKRYRRYKILQYTLIAAGAGIVGYDIASQSGSSVRFNPFMAFGIVVGGSSYFLETPKSDELWFAADAFNTIVPVKEADSTATP